ncbi:hypothetical protein YSA_02350 [Pseudomonas putida ND6]|uniref:Uncharacterized protein n=2 Tax=Pseudomonas TaxID=286 RepID=I3URC0_PSEPU|nr:hypothetical protein YSA_02350 [Pseudomonas putida ND6]
MATGIGAGFRKEVQSLKASSSKLYSHWPVLTLCAGFAGLLWLFISAGSEVGNIGVIGAFHRG